jgi:hypothetical protein
MQRAYLLLFASTAIFVIPTSAFAHGVGVACTINADKVEVEAFYDDDSPAFKAKVQVVNANEDVIATGITDKDGKWTFATPAPGKYQVRLDAGAGHRAKKALHIPGEEPKFEVPTEAPPPTVTPTAEPETRAEMTRTPWLRIGVGLGAIFVGSIAVIGVMQWRAANHRR